MKRITLALCLATPLATANAQGTEQPEAEYRKQLHSNILEGYQDLANQSLTLADEATAYCQSPSPEGLEQTRTAWFDAFMAWQQVRFVDFGPVVQGNRAWQFQFWPDPKNLVARKAAYLLNGDARITPEKISESGVAVQGFPMVEYLIYDQAFNNSDHALPDGRSCKLLVTVSRHIAENGKSLLDDWSNFQGDFVGNPQYTDISIRAAMAGLEILEERRLATPMGLRGNGKRSVYGADAWRSGASLMAAAASVRGLQHRFLPAFSGLLEGSRQSNLAEEIQQQFNEVLAHFPGLDQPMGPLLADDNAYKLLQSFYIDVTQLTSLVNDRAAVELGVVRGFNSSDGD